MVFKKQDDKSKDNKEGKKDEGQDSQETPEQSIKRLQAQLKGSEHLREKTQEELNSSKEDLAIVLEKQKHSEGLVKALRIELKTVTNSDSRNIQKADQEKPGEETPTTSEEVAGTADALCAVCKTKFNSEAALIKDREARTYLSLRCPHCGKVQNAEAAQARFK